MEKTQKPSVAVVVLAAGHGKRMQSDIPKCLTPLHGKPLVRHLLDHIEASKVASRVAIVVGHKREEVMAELGDSYEYAIQEEQRGTGHAVMSAKNTLEGKADIVLVLYGDMPYLKPETIRNIIETHTEKNATLTMATVTVPDFEEWRAGFFDFSRVIRDEAGNIKRTVEKKDQTEEEHKICEVNPAYMCFDAQWLWKNITELKDENAQNEYYLTDLIGKACEQEVTIASVSIDPKEAMGVNTKEQLELIHTL